MITDSLKLTTKIAINSKSFLWAVLRVQETYQNSWQRPILGKPSFTWLMTWKKSWSELETLNK